MEYKSIFGRCLLLEILEKKRMSQADLSYRTNISRSQINEYINNGRIMSFKNARIISCELGCKMEDLYEWSTDKHRGL